ncbi:hypothetical protein J41TS2_07710 [Bacillus sonorensis]|nr:hypothetical protein J41TS2_07710 [Bacillus sonorensis]
MDLFGDRENDGHCTTVCPNLGKDKVGRTKKKTKKQILNTYVKLVIKLQNCDKKIKSHKIG